jgi:hypothetical protein
MDADALKAEAQRVECVQGGDRSSLREIDPRSPEFEHAGADVRDSQGELVVNNAAGALGVVL